MRRTIIGLFLVQAGINLIGALGPEISFDALWYHLPIARLIAERGWWGVVPGGLLYYTGLPRLWEFVNALLLTYGSEIAVKVLHWSSGLMAAGLVYGIASRYFRRTTSLAAAALWYSNLVVGWQSVSAYTDLVRTLFVLVGAWYTLEHIEHKRPWAWTGAAIGFGLAYSVKAISLAEGIIFGSVILQPWKPRWQKEVWPGVGYYLILLVFVLLWGLLNVAQGYSFIYPFVSEFSFLSESIRIGFWELLGPLPVFYDPRYRTGPIVLLLLVVGWRFLQNQKLKSLLVVTIASLGAWYIIPRTGFGRFFLPSLALLSVLGVSELEGKKNGASWRYKAAWVLVVLSCIVGIVYRGAANSKFVPYVLGQESREEFLRKHLPIEAGNWYDADGWVANHLGGERYLVKGVHNTYYLPGGFDHESWADPTYCYPWVVAVGETSPDEELELVHGVMETGTKIYRNYRCQ